MVMERNWKISLTFLIRQRFKGLCDLKVCPSTVPVQYIFQFKRSTEQRQLTVLDKIFKNLCEDDKEV